MSTPMVLRARVRAPIADVRRALTDPTAMRIWLAEHAEADLPDTYAFWGRYTPDGAVPRQRPLRVDEYTLRFTWTLDGQETVVEITLEEDGAATILSLSQSHVPDWREVLSESGIRCVLPTFWALAIANLADYVEGREPTALCDFTSPELRVEVGIGVPPQEVFHSLVDPERFRQWFGADVEIEPYVGGRWAMGGFDRADPPAKIIDLTPGRGMVLDWGAFVSTWELEGSDAKTRLTFVQSGFNKDHPPYGGWMGWLSGIAGLRRFHELSDWSPTFVHGMSDLPELCGATR